MDGLMIFGIILFLAGFVFVAIETVVPGFGVPGILGICCLVAGVFLTADTVSEAVFIVAVVVVLLAIMIFVIINMLSRGKFRSPIVLDDSLTKEEGFISSTDLQYLVGMQGVTVTDLHPAGRVRIDDVEFDVVSDGKFIESNTVVEIYTIRNSSLVVRRKEPQ